MRKTVLGNGRVALGMSGGVDSSVAAALLRDAGYEVVGVTLRFCDAPSQQTAEADAADVCRKLGIAHTVFSATERFDERVVRPFVAGYAKGLTPSPCVGCNATCKMPSLSDAADAAGCDLVATGHYARVVDFPATGRFAVKRALDPAKDQSYMLGLLGQETLSRLMLPLGAMTKLDVRLIAADLGLSVAEKPDSQDNCFVEGDYRDFLRARGCTPRPGAIVTASGERVGTHEGLAFYTLGQRKGIGVAAPQPYYVIGKRTDENELVVGFKDETLIRGVETAPAVWQAFTPTTAPSDAMVKLRYRSEAAPCIIGPADEGGVRIELRSPRPVTAPGQYAVWYTGDTVVGAAMIKEVWQ